MSQKIDEILKKMATATSRENTPISSTIKPANNLLGASDCPICHGQGFYRLDAPVGHPEFGKIQICVCRTRQVGDEVRQRLFSLSNLNELSHLTFENFHSRGRVGLKPFQADSLERACNQARQFAQSLKGWLLLQGDYGCGKTHLAAAIANFAVSMGVSTLFLTVPDLLDHLRFAYNDKEASFEDRFEEVRRSNLLILDDFGTQNATSWAQEKLFQILNYRYVNHLPLVVTTNLSLDEMEDRIRSRLQDPELVSKVRIVAPDYRNPTDDTGQSELSTLALHYEQTFSHFENRKEEGLKAEFFQNLDKALQTAIEYSRNPVGWLVLTGVHSCGKSHLAAAIANARAELGDQPLFIFVPDLLDHLRATFAPGSSVRYDHRFDEIKKVHLLVLDGLGAQTATQWASEKLYQLFDYRYNAKLPTVITMTKMVEDLEIAEPHLVSRMMDRRLCAIFAITAPPYRGGVIDEKKTPARRQKSRTTS